MPPRPARPARPAAPSASSWWCPARLPSRRPCLRLHARQAQAQARTGGGRAALPPASVQLTLPHPPPRSCAGRRRRPGRGRCLGSSLGRCPGDCWAWREREREIRLLAASPSQPTPVHCIVTHTHTGCRHRLARQARRRQEPVRAVHAHHLAAQGGACMCCVACSLLKWAHVSARACSSTAVCGCNWNLALPIALEAWAHALRVPAGARSTHPGTGGCVGRPVSARRHERHGMAWLYPCARRQRAACLSRLGQWRSPTALRCRAHNDAPTRCRRR